MLDRILAFIAEHLANLFHGADGTASKTYSAQTFSAEKDGWLVAGAAVTTAQTIQPIIRILANGQLLAEGIGLTINGTALNTAAYVKKGAQITIQCYRCSYSSSKLFYAGGYRKDWNFNGFGDSQRYRKAVGIC